MGVRITSEKQVVEDAKLRAMIIEDIEGNENLARKAEAFRRHMQLKDRTSYYVIEELLKQFDPETVREMNYSLANISVARKVIDKLARVYSNGVKRTVEKDEKATEAVENIAKIMSFNTRMKTANRYLRAHKNVMVGVLPVSYEENEQVLYGLQLQVLEPYLYDVVEHEQDREKPMFVILSHYDHRSGRMYSQDASAEGRSLSSPAPSKISDGKDSTIADAPVDQGACEDKQYVWWSKYYHFTTNAKGEITSGDILNPIQEMPWENFAIDQENSFWAEGGSDIFDGCVKVNCMITNVDHIGVTQGYGQFYMKGKNLPRHIKTGVNKAILMEVENKDDPDPQIGFASSSPELQALKEQIIMYVALLLSTNNLSTRSVSTQLGGADDFPSGIAMMLDKAESIEDVADQQEIFREKEPKLFDKIKRWQDVYKESLTDDFKKYMLPDEMVLNLKFGDARTIMSEKEKLENIKMRKDLGINTMIELLMMDDQSLTEKQAEDRLKKLLEEKIENQLRAQENMGQNKPEDEDESGEGDGEQQQDSVGDRPGDSGPAPADQE